MSKNETNNGYQVVGVTTPTQVVPDAEMLRRDDTDAGKWTIHSSSAQAGEPKTAVAERQMFVPTYDDEHSRHVRAHEMFHAKVSPTTKQWEKVWTKRAWAGERTLTACEELRVNTLMRDAGFEPHLHLQDGSEMRNGIQMATHNDFQTAVLASISLGNTAGLEPFLAGVGQVRPEWVDVLSKITENGVKFYNSIRERNDLCDKEEQTWRKIPDLSATGSKAPEHGFGYTEQLAKWVEQMVGAIGTPPPKPEKTKEGAEAEGKKGKGKGKKSGEGEDGDGDGSELSKLLKAISKSGKSHRNERQSWGRGTVPNRGAPDSWGTLKISKPPLVRNVIGAIGKKRIASPTGRNPRRMSRLLTDPERRIFDRIVKGEGGVVLVDTSGSMSLTSDEVKEIVLHAPSALVAQYSGGSRTRPNLYVIANKGKMCEELPDPNGMNEVDLPALRWAVKSKQRPTSPVIWVSDGGVTGKRDTWCTDLVMEVIKFCQKENVFVVPTPADAIELLKKIQRREKVTSIIPELLERTYKEVTSRTLVLR